MGDYSELSLTSRKRMGELQVEGSVERPFGCKSLELSEPAKALNVLPRTQLVFLYHMGLVVGRCGSRTIVLDEGYALDLQGNRVTGRIMNGLGNPCPSRRSY